MDQNDSRPTEKQAPEGQIPPSVLAVEFTFPGSAEFAFHMQNVSPTQMMAAAAYLEWQAERMLEQAAQREEAARANGKLIVPELVLGKK